MRHHNSKFSIHKKKRKPVSRFLETMVLLEMIEQNGPLFEPGKHKITRVQAYDIALTKLSNHGI